MSSSKASQQPSHGPSYFNDRFYNASAIRRHQQLLLQQQNQVILHQQMLHKQQHLQQQQQWKIKHSFTEKTENGTVSFRVPTNLDRLMDSVTPFVSVESSETGQRTQEVDSHPFFCLKALWESFNEWSAYGAGVPLLLNGKDPIEQYYVPFLSGIQLYTDPSKASSELKLISSDLHSGRNAKVINGNMQRLDKLSLGDKSSMNLESEVTNLPGLPSFHFVEYEQPHNRRPLADKISVLISQHPELSKWRSCDLLPTSWICVAWYPIYRIPVGPTLQDLDACFLTFHSLSTQSKSKFPPQFHAPNTRKVKGIVDPDAKFSLPVFALASYKLKGSILSPCGPHECEQENALLRSADEWLTRLKVNLPDYQFFRFRHSSPR